jgi:hypothetical protein
MRPIHHAARRRAALLAMAASIALLASACSNSSTGSTGSDSATGQSTAYQKGLAYAQCIRAHGIPDFPDPNSKGQFYVANGSTGSLPNVSKAVASAAAKACQKLVPPSMAQGPPQGGQGAKATNQGLKFSACMRSHGEPDFPDQASNGSFTLPAGMNAESPQFQAAEKDCQSLMPNNPSGQGAP